MEPGGGDDHPGPDAALLTATPDREGPFATPYWPQLRGGSSRENDAILHGGPDQRLV